MKNFYVKPGIVTIVAIIILATFFSFKTYASGLSAGTYTINASASASASNYKNFTSAVDDMLYGTRTDGGTAAGPGILGAVTFNVANGSYSEQILISAISGASATNTVTFKSASGDSNMVILTSASSASANPDYTLRLNGANWITFKEISIRRTGTARYAVVVSLMNGASNNQFIGNWIMGQYGPSNNTYAFPGSAYGAPDAIVSDSAETSPYDTNNLFNGNHITYGYNGFDMWYGVDNKYTNNIIDSPGCAGIYSSEESKILISGNIVTLATFPTTNYVNYGCRMDYISNYKCIGNRFLCSDSSVGTVRCVVDYYSIGTSSQHNLIANNFCWINGGTSACTGITVGYNQYLDIFYNSVNLTSLTSGASAFDEHDVSTGGSNIQIIDNIFVNTGNGYAYNVESGQGSNISASNYNDIYSTSSYFATWNGTNESNLTNLHNASGFDGNSISKNPGFVSRTDLDISNSALHGAGTYESEVTIDIHDSARHNPPCIGADEFTPLAYSIGISSIDSPQFFCASSKNVYVNFTNYGTTTVTSAQINWSVNGTLQSAYSWSGSVSSGNEVTYINIGSFSFSANTPYTIKAWCSLPNGQPDGNPSSDTLSVVREAAMSGSYLIGSDFSSFNNAILALTSRGVCGPTIINVKTGAYYESVSIPAIVGASATNTITFQSQSLDSALSILTYACDNATGTNIAALQLNGANWVTIQKLTIQRTGFSATNFVGQVVDIESGSNNNRFLNNQLLGPSLNGSTPSSTYTANINASGGYSETGVTDTGNWYKNNLIRNGSYGYAGIGLSGTPNSGNVFQGNTIDSSYYDGLWSEYDYNIKINNNIFTHLQETGSYPVFLEYCNNNIGVSANQIIALNYEAAGIYLYSCTGTSAKPALVANNYISMDLSGSTSYGIELYNDAYINTYYNSINLYGTATTASADYYLTSSGSNYNIENNIFANQAGGYSIDVPSGYSGSIAAMNYNDYYFSGSYLGVWNGTAETTLTAWRSATSKDGNSQTYSPGFTSNTLLDASNGLLRYATPLSSVTTDIYGHARSLTAPTVGADEIPYSYDAGVTAITSPATTTFCAGSDTVKVTLKNFSNAALTSATLNWYVNHLTQTAVNWTGSLAINATATVSLGTYSFTAGSDTVKAWSTSPNGGTDANPGDDTSKTVYSVNALPPAPVAGSSTICEGSYVSIGAGAAGGYSYSWASNPAGFSSTSSNPSVSPTVNTTYTLTESNNTTGCTSLNSVTIAVNPLPAANAGSNINLCPGSNTTIGATAVAGDTYAWVSNPSGYTSSVSNPSVSPTATTTYTLTETITATGCSSSNSVVITVFTPAAYTISDTTICSGSSIYIGGAPAGSDTYAWVSNPSGFTSTASDPSVSPTTTTTYYLTETAVGGCSKSDSVVISVNPAPAANPGTPSSICDGQSAPIGATAVAGDTYSWSSNPSGYANAASSANVSPTVTTTYKLTETITTTGCTASNSVVITVYPLPAAYTGGNAAICTGSNKTIGATAVAGDSYSWVSNPADASLNTTEANPSVSPTTTTTYTLTESNNTTGCTNSNSIVITVNPVPAADAGSPSTICGGSAAGIGATAVSGDSYSWASNPAGFTSAVSNPSVSPTATTTYTLKETITATGCTAANSVVITVNPAPAAYTGSNQRINSGSPATIGGAAVSGDTYSWISNPSGFTSTVSNPTVSPTVNTTYTLTETVTATGCSKSNSVVITIGGHTFTINPHIPASSTNYHNFTSAVDDMVSGTRTDSGAPNGPAISGAVTFSVASGTYNESIVLTSISGASATNTITFESAANDSADVILNGATTYTVQFNGSKYVTFNEITIKSNGGYALDFIGGSFHNTITNCVVTGTNQNTSSTANTPIYEDAPASPDSANHFLNNVINGGYYGIYWYAPSYAETGNWFKGNTIQNQGVYPVMIEYYQNYFVFSNNYINTAGDYEAIYGIYLYDLDATGPSTITGNKIYATGTCEYPMYIIYTAGTSSHHSLIANNMISVINASPLEYAMLIEDNTYTDIAFNNIYIDGLSTWYYGAVIEPSSNSTFKDNIIETTTTPGDYTVYFSGMSSSTVNYNDWYSGTGSYSFDVGGTVYSSFRQYQSASGYDKNGNDLNPEYVSPSSMNLDITNSCLAGAGLYYSTVPLDINGTTRANPPTIGADELKLVSLDARLTLDSPGAGFCGNATKNIYVTIGNYGTATLTSATIGWSVNGTAQTPVNWTGSIPECTGTPAKIELGSYYIPAGATVIKAWSYSPNGGTDQNPAADTLNYTYYTAFNGTFTIGGSSPNFTTIGQAVAILNQAGVCGPTVFNIRDGIYNETVQIGSITGVSATNTVTFQSQNKDSNNVIITYSYAPTVYLIGASYITFNEVSIKNPSGTDAVGGAAVSILGGSFHNNFTNCYISATTAGGYPVYMYDPSVIDSANHFINNVIVGGIYTLYVYGYDVSPYPTGNWFIGNQVDSAQDYSTYIYYQNYFKFNNNYMTGCFYTYAGSYMYYLTNGSQINNNKWFLSSTNDNGPLLYYFTGTAAHHIQVTNNWVSGGGNGDVWGIYEDDNSYIDVMFNNVLIYGSGNDGFAYFSSEAGTADVVEDNNFINTGNSSTSASAFTQSSGTPTFDYNNLYTGSSFIAFWANSSTSTTGPYTGAYTSLSSFNSACGGSHNVSVNPGYPSNTNLYSFAPGIYRKGLYVAAYPTDMEGNTRHNPPCIGADEFLIVSSDPGIFSIDSPYTYCSGSQRIGVIMKNYGTNVLTSDSIYWTVNGTPQTAIMWTGSLAAGASANVYLGNYTFSALTNYAVKAWTTDPNGGIDSNQANDTAYQNFYSSLNGTYTINPAGSGVSNFTSFSAAITALNSYGVCAPVTFNVANGSYFENLTFNYIKGISAINTVTFQSASGDSSLVIVDPLTGRPATFNDGSEYITLKGMTFWNRSGTSAIILPIGGAFHLTFSHDILRASTNSYCFCDQDLYNPSDRITFNECAFHGGAYGIYTQSELATSGNIVYNHMQVLNCYMDSFADYGIYSTYDDSLIVSGSYFTNCASGAYPIYISDAFNSFTITGNTVYVPNGCEYALYIYENTTTTATSLIANNFLEGASSGTYFNYIYGNNLVDFIDNNIYTTAGYGLYYYTNNGGHIEDNIFMTTANTYAIYNDNLATGSVVDNDYWAPNSSTPYYPSSPAPAYNLNPDYIGAPNLNITQGGLSGKGIAYTGITTDINGNLRHNPPTIGADEYVPPAATAGVLSIDSPVSYCGGGSPQNCYVTIKNYGTATLTSVDIIMSVNSRIYDTVKITSGLSLAQNAVKHAIFLDTFSSGNVVAYTYLPNGVPDQVPANDTAKRDFSSALTGVYTINPAGSGPANYISFAAALAALKNQGICGPVVFNVANGTYQSSLDITPIVGANAINTITFQSASSDSANVILQYPALSSPVNNYVVWLNGCSFVTFKEITIQRTYSNTYENVITLSSEATYNRFLNCVIRGATATSNAIANALVLDNGDTSQYNTFSRNALHDGSYGFYISGNSSGSTYQAGNIFSGNTIDSSYYAAMYIAYQVAPVISNNIITNVQTAGYGIYTNTTTGPEIVSGNQLYMLNATYGMYLYDNVATSVSPGEVYNNFVSNGGAVNSGYGIYAYSCSYYDFYFNNINNYNTVSGSYPFYASLTTNPVLENNIFNNASGGPTIYMGSAASAINYNDYYTTGATWGYYNGTTETSFSTSWAGAHSLSGNPDFTSNTNLRDYWPGLQGAGIAISGITTDIFGDTRNNPPDIGAYEFAAPALDAGISAFTSPAAGYCAGNVTVKATFTNYGTSTLTADSIHWSLNGVMQTPIYWTGSLATGNTSAAITLGSVSVPSGANIFKAWLTYLNGGVTANPNNDTLTTGIASSLNGVYTINANGSGATNYTTFGAAVAAITGGGICGPVVFNVAAGTYPESLIIPAISGASATNTISFVGVTTDSTQVNLVGNGSSYWTVELSATKYINFKHMTISAGIDGYAVWVYNNSTYDTFASDIIAQTATSTSPYISSAVYTNGDAGDDYNVFLNSSITGGYYTIYWYGSTAYTNGKGDVFQGCQIGSASEYDIYLYYTTGLTFNHNIITGGYYGIYGFYSNGMTITRNQFYSIGDYPFYWEYIDDASYGGGSGTPTNVANNFFTCPQSYGMYIIDADYINWDFNNFYFSYSSTGTYGLFLDGDASTAYTSTFLNNIIYAPNGFTDLIYDASQLASSAASVNYNDYYASNFTNFGYASQYGTYSTFAAWQTGTGWDKQSLTINPQYLNPGAGDLHNEAVGLYEEGTPVNGITIDIDGNTRTNPPDIGAYQFNPPATGAGIVSIDTPGLNFCAGTTYNVHASLSDFGLTTLTSATIQWWVNGAAQTSVNWTGSITSGNKLSLMLGTLTTLAGNTYQISAKAVLPNGIVYNQSNDSFGGPTIGQALSGTFTINPSLPASSTNFTTFASVAAALGNGVCGPVVFNIANGTYNSEVVLPAIIGSSATNTITFQSASGDSAAVVISSSSNAYAVEMDGITYCTIKGVTLLGADYPVYWVTQPCQGDRFTHCVIRGGEYGILAENLPAGHWQVDHSHIVALTEYGVLYYGQSGGHNVLNFNNNICDTFEYGGIYCEQYADSITIANNIFKTPSNLTCYYAIYNDDYLDAYFITANKIYLNNSEYGIYSYFQDNTNTTSASLLANNMICGTFTDYGVYIYENGSADMYYNSIVNLGSTYTVYIPIYPDADGSVGLAANNNIEDNNFVNLGGGYPMYEPSYPLSSYWGTVNYNNYYTTGTNLADYDGTSYTTIASIHSGTGAENNGQNVNPSFLNTSVWPYDLHAYSVGLYQKGVYLSAVTTDIDGKPRNNPPCIGANEFVPPANGAGVTTINSPGQIYCTGTSPLSVTIENFGTANLTSVKVFIRVDSVVGGVNYYTALDSAILTGINLASNATQLVSSFPSYTFYAGNGLFNYSIKAWCKLPNGQTNGSATNDTVQLNNLTQGFSGLYTINPNGSGPTNYTSFTTAIAAMQINGICGPVTFNVANGVYAGNLYLTPVSGTSPVNTITFQSASGDSALVTIGSNTSYTANSYGVYMEGITYCTFKGITFEADYPVYWPTTNPGYAVQGDRFTHCVMRGEFGIYAYQLYSPGGHWEVDHCHLSAVGGDYGIEFIGNDVSDNSILNFNNNIIDTTATYGGLFEYADSANIANNVIKNANTVTYGIYLYEYYNAAFITGNKISGNATYGLYIYYQDNSNATAQGLIANNMICGSYSTAAIYNDYGGNFNYYFNSICNLGSGYCIEQVYYPCNLGSSIGQPTLNNFENNNYVSLGGGTPLYFVNGTAAGSTYFGTLNYNNYWAPSSTYLLDNVGTNYTYSTFSSFGKEANSINVNPGFTNTSTYPYNLNANSSSVAGKGTYLTAVTTDIYGNARHNPPCIGANEFVPSPYDAGLYSINSPSTIYCAGPTPLSVTILNYGTANLTSVKVFVQVDSVVSGVNHYTALDSAIVTGINIPQLGTTTVTNFNSTYDFGAANGLFSYKIKAWTKLPDGQPDGNPSDDTAAENTGQGFSGTYTINPNLPAGSGNYQSFTTALSAMQAQGICGPVVFNVANGTYIGGLTLTAVAGASPTNTITFQSASGDSNYVTIGSNSYTEGILLDGITYCTIKGMTILGSTYGVYAYNGTQNTLAMQGDRFTHCVFRSEYPVYVQYPGPGHWEVDNSHLVATEYALYYYVDGITGNILNFNNNLCDTFAIYAMYCLYADSININHNIFKTSNNITYGLYLADYYDGMFITANKFYFGGTCTIGLYLDFQDNTNITTQSIVANNMIEGTFSTAGIEEIEVGTMDLFFNSIVDLSGSASSYGVYYDYYIGYADGTYAAQAKNSIENNNFVNLGSGYGLYFSSNAASNFSTEMGAMDYDNYYTATGNNLMYLSSVCNSIGAIQTATGNKEQHAVSTNPIFVNTSTWPYDLHAQSAGLYQKGNYLASVPTDIDGNTRNNPPCIGANEFVPPQNHATITAIDNPGVVYCSGTTSIIVTLQNLGIATLTSDSITWRISDTLKGYYKWTGSLASGATTPVTVGTYNFVSGTYFVTAESNLPNGVTDANPADSFVGPVIGLGMSGTFTIGAGGNYTTFQNAVAALSANGICGPVVFNVLTGSYTGPVSIPAIKGTSAVNTITFQSATLDSANVVLSVASSSTATYTNYALGFSGASWIIVKEMTLAVTGSTASYYGSPVGFSANSYNITITNCVITGIASCTNSNSDEITAYNGSAYAIDTGIYINNNLMTGGYYGLFVADNSTGYASTYITNNTIKNYEGYSIYAVYNSNLLISGNTIAPTYTSTLSYLMLIEYVYGNGNILNNTITYSNTITYGMYDVYNYGNMTISGNKFNLAASTYGMLCEYISGSLNLSNNMITATGTMTSPFLIEGLSGNVNNITNNTISSSSSIAEGLIFEYNGYNPGAGVANGNVVTTISGNIWKGTGYISTYGMELLYEDASENIHNNTFQMTQSTACTAALYSFYNYGYEAAGNGTPNNNYAIINNNTFPLASGESILIDYIGEANGTNALGTYQVSNNTFTQSAGTYVIYDEYYNYALNTKFVGNTFNLTGPVTYGLDLAIASADLTEGNFVFENNKFPVTGTGALTTGVLWTDYDEPNFANAYIAINGNTFGKVTSYGIEQEYGNYNALYSGFIDSICNNNITMSSGNYGIFSEYNYGRLVCNGNTISGTTTYGIAGEYADYTVNAAVASSISNNTINASSYGIYALEPTGTSANSGSMAISNNNINVTTSGNTYGIYRSTDYGRVSCNNNAITGSAGYGIYYTTNDNLTATDSIYNNTIAATTYGIYATQPTGSTTTGNSASMAISHNKITMTGGTAGIFRQNDYATAVCNYNTIAGSATNGIELSTGNSTTANNSISHNTITAGSGEGIFTQYPNGTSAATGSIVMSYNHISMGSTGTGMYGQYMYGRFSANANNISGGTGIEYTNYNSNVADSIYNDTIAASGNGIYSQTPTGLSNGTGSLTTSHNKITMTGGTAAINRANDYAQVVCNYNTISGSASYGIEINTANSTTSNNSISNNSISASRYGIYMSEPAGSTISTGSMRVYGDAITLSSGTDGIYSGTCYGTLTIDSNSVTQAGGTSIALSSNQNYMQVTRNALNNSGSSAFGINATSNTGASGTPSIIGNNSVAMSGNAATGIYISNGTYQNFYGNNINCTGTGATTALNVAAMASGSNNNVADNVFATTSTTNVAATVAQNAANLASMNYNDYYNSTGTNFMSYNGTAYANTTAGWVAYRTASGTDANSFSANPLYTSATNLAINSCALKNRGTTLSGATLAYYMNGYSKNAMPDCGASYYNGIPATWTGADGGSAGSTGAAANWSIPWNWCNDTVPSCASGSNVILNPNTIKGITPTNPVVETTEASANNLTLNAGSQLTIDSRFDLCGNYVNNGGALITNTPDTFNLSGSGTQNFAGGTYYSLTANGGGTKNLTSSAYIDHKVALGNNSIIYTNNGNRDDTITLDPSAIVMEDGSDYILGWAQITHVLSPSVMDSFGNIGSSITIGTNYPHTYDTILCVRHTGPAAVITGEVQPGGYQYQGIQRNYTLIPSTNGHLGMSMVWHYFPGELNGIPAGDLATYRREANHSYWNYVGYSSRDSAANTISNTGQDSLSDWTFGSSITPLPVQLIYFTATLEDPETVRLNWVTESEINSDSFIIERSIDGGKSFGKIGEVKGSGTTVQQHSYTYLDNNVDLLATCNLYYELRQKDYNGNVNNPGGGIQEVTLCQATIPGNSTKAWYDQAEDRVYLNIERTSAMNVSVVLTDDRGKIITSQSIEAGNGLTQATLNMTGFAKGIYNIKVTDQTGSVTQRVMKY